LYINKNGKITDTYSTGAYLFGVRDQIQGLGYSGQVLCYGAKCPVLCASYKYTEKQMQVAQECISLGSMSWNIRNRPKANSC
jgi:hypothetical protein